MPEESGLCFIARPTPNNMVDLTRRKDPALAPHKTASLPTLARHEPLEDQKLPAVTSPPFDVAILRHVFRSILLLINRTPPSHSKICAPPT